MFFNQENNVKMNEIDKLPQRDTNEHLGRLPSQIEAITAIKGTASEKVSDKSGVATNMLKNLPLEGLNLLTYLFKNYC
jgi:hypothetical protein